MDVLQYIIVIVLNIILFFKLLLMNVIKKIMYSMYLLNGLNIPLNSFDIKEFNSNFVM